MRHFFTDTYATAYPWRLPPFIILKHVPIETAATNKDQLRRVLVLDFTMVIEHILIYGNLYFNEDSYFHESFHEALIALALIYHQWNSYCYLCFNHAGFLLIGTFSAPHS